uniref:Intraflagellar transport protein 46 homolog n=1 Tax=Oryzias melastigma TaxID=30732 RepID=A0A3B3BJK7_ORYME
MERTERTRGPRLLRNQPYDESLEVAGDHRNLCSPEPGTPRQRRVRSLMSACSSSEEFDEEPRPHRAAEPAARTRPGASPNEEEEEEEEEESESEDSDEDEDEESSQALEYDPADYTNLPVSTDIRELFQYITRYTPQSVDLELRLKPFIPDFIPAVGPRSCFLSNKLFSVPRPDGKPDSLGLLLLDEPSVKQSDPTVLTLRLSEESKQQGTDQTVASVSSPHTNPRAVDSWVDSISALHRSKPPASVHYSRPLPDIDSLMQEWPPEMEELLGRLRPPPARLSCSLEEYVDVACGLLDIPVSGSRIQSLHLLFSLYLEFRDSLHFTSRE